jgi:hypothetical protein
MDRIESQIYDIEQNLAREQRKLQDLRAELEKQREEARTRTYDRYKGKLCLFWDKEVMLRSTFQVMPQNAMIRPFIRAERRTPYGNAKAEMRFYACDMYTGEEIGHVWKNFRAVTKEELNALLVEPEMDDASI